MGTPAVTRARGTRWALAAALIALAGWLAMTFSQAPAGPCTLVDANAGLEVRSDGGDSLPFGWNVEVQSSGQWVAAGGSDEVRFARIRLPRSGQRQLQLRITDAAGQVVVQDELVVDVASYSPNGEECGPTVGRAALTVSSDGTFAPARSASGLPGEPGSPGG